jgi:hypothetical protein
MSYGKFYVHLYLPALLLSICVSVSAGREMGSYSFDLCVRYTQQNTHMALINVSTTKKLEENDVCMR